MSRSTPLLSAAAAAALAAAAFGLRRYLERRRKHRLLTPQNDGPSEVPVIDAVSASADAETLADGFAAALASATAAHVRAEGVCVVSRLFAPSELAPLRAAIDALEPRKLQNRRAHRWEHVHDPDAAVFQELAARPEIAAIVRALLGSKTYLEKAGLILSHPGAEAQRWHMDNPHLYAIPTHLPPHSLTVFVALCELTAANGPTEFHLATHVKAHLAAPRKRHAAARCAAGSLVVYDTRILHRGGANASDAERPLVYMTFSRVWFRDTVNP